MIMMVILTSWGADWGADWGFCFLLRASEISASRLTGKNLYPVSRDVKFWSWISVKNCGGGRLFGSE